LSEFTYSSEIKTLIYNVQNSIFYTRRLLIDAFAKHLHKSLISNIEQTQIICYILLASYLLLAIGQYIVGAKLLNKSRNEERIFLKIKGKECYRNFKSITNFASFAQNPNTDFEQDSDTDSYILAQNANNQQNENNDPERFKKRTINTEFTYSFYERFEFTMRIIISVIISLIFIIAIYLLNLTNGDIMINTALIRNDTSRIEYDGFSNQAFHQYFLILARLKKDEYF